MTKAILPMFSFAFAAFCILAAASAERALATVAPQNPPPHDPPYPTHWWTPVSSAGAPEWEILPQAAAYGEVILSKRNELGILSNFAATPFTFHGKKYASVEGFWQATKYPENADDPRAKAAASNATSSSGVTWTHTRHEVEQMTAFEAKKAGDLGSDNMKKLGIDWVTFEGKRYIYKQPGDSPFYKLIVEVERAKLEQNPGVREILLKTDDLVLKPDHKDDNAPSLKAWRYYEIWMMLRKELKAGHGLASCTDICRQ